MNKFSFYLTTFVLFFLGGCSAPKVSESIKNTANPTSHLEVPEALAVKNLFGTNVKKEYFTGGKLRSEFIMSNDTGQNGLLKKYGYDGKLNSIVTIQQGMKHGTETLFDAKGRVLKKTPYINNQKEGLLEAYYTNGNVMMTINYVNNQRHGKATKYNKDGSINQQVQFLNGKLSN